MTIEPTEEGGLSFGLQVERDWEIFEFLVRDAEGRGEGWLAKRLGVVMDDEDWDELVVPSLTTQFEGEVAKVRNILREAFDLFEVAKQAAEQEAGSKGGAASEDAPEDQPREEDPALGQVVITREDGGCWYSVFNQARLALEGKWKLSKLEEEEDFGSLDNIEPDRLSAYLRSRFYNRIQALLLDFVIDL